MNFLREKLLTEDYSFAELENFIEKIPINSFDDSNSICKEIIRNKRKKLERNYNYIDIALGSKTYIDLNGSIATENLSIVFSILYSNLLIFIYLNKENSIKKILESNLFLFNNKKKRVEIFII